MAWIFVFSFALHLIVNLERILFINELYSLLGFIILVCSLVSSSQNSYKACFKYFSLLFVYATAHLLISLPKVFDFGTLALRTYAVYYSMYSLFLGLYLYKNKHVIEHIFGKLTAAGAIFLGGVLSNPVAILLSVKFKIGLPLVFLMTALVGFKNGVLNQGSSTMVINLAFLTLIWTFKKRFAELIEFCSGGFFVLLCFFGLITFLFLIYPFISPMAALGLLEFELIDPNNLWRILFWSKSLNDLWVDGLYVLGRGLGGALFDYDSADSKFLIDANPDDLNLAFTIGMHNSFLYFLVRYGFIGFFLFILPVMGILRRSVAITGFSGNNGFFVIGLFFMLVNSFFNVILESALYSSIFWILLGYCYGIIYYSKFSSINKGKKNNV